MKLSKYITSLGLLLMTGIFSGCIYDDYTACPTETEDVNLVISVAGMNSKHLTRANSDRTDRSRIEDMNIVLADAAGVIQEIIYVPKDTKANSNLGTEDNGLINGDLPMDSGTLSFHVGSKSWAGKTQIYIVCNYWQVNGNGEILEDQKDLNNCLKVGTSTIDDLKALKQGTPFTAGIMTSTLFGKAEIGEGTDTHGGQIYNCELRRTTAMITVAITSGSGNEKLNYGVKITPRSIQLHNVPTECNIGIESAINLNKITGTPNGLSQQVGWDPLTSANHGTTVGGHGNDPNIVPLFMFENRQGIMDNAGGEQIQKAPDAGKENYCSYLEVTADYLYTPQNENQKFISGPIKYRLYLGENILDDFNVNRNKHYQVTLSLKGMGGLVEDGKTDKEGNFIGEGADASWRVESSGVTGGGSFLTEGLNMASNGFLSYVGFVGESGHNYAIYCEEGAVGGATWLWAQTNAGIVTPTEDFPAIIYSAEECGGEPGVSYILLYAQPWLDEYGSWEQWSQGDISTIPNWINNGYRVAHLILKDTKTGQEVSRFEARQWLPMPVMVDNNGNQITSVNPNDASFYYSRIDVYEGKEIPWGPDYFNNWDAANLNINSVSFYQNGLPGYPGVSDRDFNAKFGFDNTIALYGTNPNAFDFQNDFGRPGDAIGAAIFRAGNAVTSSGGSISYSFKNMARIGLPTTEEWDKIMKYGIVDVRFGISNVPYWTSSMSGTQSYTYNPISGEKSLENRDTKHRTRLVYHKNDFAVKK